MEQLDMFAPEPDYNETIRKAKDKLKGFIRLVIHK
jgi:hypothetical protein